MLVIGNDTEVIFQLFEKTPLLTEADTALKVVQEGKEVEEVIAKVKDGYAVTEIELKPKAETDFKKWLTTLKANEKLSNRKKSYFWIKAKEREGVVNAEFYKEDGVEMISTNWHEPITNPQRNKYNYYGDEKPKSSAFGKVRSDETKFHQGLDIFAVPGTDIVSSLAGKVVEKRTSSSVGNVVTIEVTNKNEIINRRLSSNYNMEFPSTGSKGEYEKGLSFNLNDNSKIYLRHYHLSSVDVKKGDMVKCGQKIGESGVTGNADKTNAPHLHLEILDTTDYTYELKDKINPAYLVNLIEIDDLIQDESVKYYYYIDGTKKLVKDYYRNGTKK